MECIFCKIVAGTIPANIIHCDDKVVVFDDIYPKAPQHKLIIPRKHIATLNDITIEDSDLISHMLFTAKKLAHDLNIAKPGYRVMINCNKGGGQEVFHLHLHLLSGFLPK
jgi:histidine triad (HIT) family protein